jgi:chromosome condensin MukBEF complex kleisin-like MukF subunit
MKTIFDEIKVNWAEFNYFKQLSKTERISFLFEIVEDAEIRLEDGMSFAKVFNMIKESFAEDTPDIKTMDAAELPDDVEKVDVMIDDDSIMIESNSLVALRHIVYKFFEAGYIISRDTQTEKLFRKDKVTRYLRIFRIIDQISTICIN